MNILFSPRAQPWLLWQVVLGRYGVMASASYRFLSIPKGSFVFRFSPWMILSPCWEQSVDLMITDRRFRQCNKSLLKTEFLRFNLKQYWLGLWGNSSHEIASDIEVNMLFHQSLPSTKCLFHMSSEKDRVWFFLADFSSWTRLPLCEEARGPLQIKQTNNRWLQLVEVCSLKFLLLLVDRFLIWSKENSMICNPSKCKEIIFRKKGFIRDNAQVNNIR